MPVSFESTPNPQTFRFATGRVLADRNAEFLSPSEAQLAPLPRKLFGFPWCAGVFIGRDFVTVTKQEWVDWDVIAEPLANLIEEHLDSGAPVLMPAIVNAAITDSATGASGAAAGATFDGTSRGTPQTDRADSSVVQMIKQLLDAEIRPMVAQDGGDVVFASYENNIVYLRMQGACAGCPSSTMTLKMGIETRLREAIPEIVSVESI